MRIPIESRSLISAIALTLLVSGCSELSAQPGEVKTVTMLLGEQGLDGCQMLGQVKGSSNDNQTNEDNTPYIDRLVKARNNLRNEARKLGGNTVHIIYANNSGKYEIPGIDKEIIFAGNAYHCE